MEEMRAIKKTVTYINVTKADFNRLYKEKNKVNDEGLVISSVETFLDENHIIVSYEDLNYSPFENEML